jgi:TonB family protein
MKTMLAPAFGLLLSCAVAMAQNVSTPEWNISNIQLSVVKKIDGANRSTVEDKSSIVEVKGSISYLLASTTGPNVPLPVIKLSGTSAEQPNGRRWSSNLVAVGINGSTGCGPYYFLDSLPGATVNRTETVGFNVVDGKVRISSARAESLCLAFSTPPSPQEMHLEFAGMDIALGATPANRTVILPDVVSDPIGVTGKRSPPDCKPVQPNYTQEARQAHVQGPVTIEAIVQKDGSMTPIRVITGLGYGLDEEAMNVLKKWTCTPAALNGQPVTFSLRVVVNFRLY